MSANGFANKAEVVATTAIAAVVVAASGAGKYLSTQGISGSGSGCSSTITVSTGGFGSSGVSGTGGSGGGGTLGIVVGLVICLGWLCWCDPLIGLIGYTSIRSDVSLLVVMGSAVLLVGFLS